jgi:histidyl-tRNA synthetase
LSEHIEPLRGMNDVLPDEAPWWNRLESVTREVFSTYGYREIRVPLLERTQLFKRAIGEHTDIVEKEMFSFEDRDGQSLALRPEATASIVRAAISNGLLHNQKHRLFTIGPMFRGERPQKGRYRQFYQVDAEAFGYSGPEVDAELILMTARMWQLLGISRVRLEINSLGTAEARARYRDLLREYFRGHYSQLDADSQRRLEGNPLRILDSKNADMAELIAAAPLLTDHLDDESKAHFERLKKLLEAGGVAYTVNPRLVRGLDYYSRTVFEWVTDALGSQNAVCSGGRYDGLVTQLGGEATPAIGWAMGMERVILLMQELGCQVPVEQPDVYVVMAGESALARGLQLAESIRTAAPGLKIETDLGGGSFKAQFKRADKSGAHVALVLGDDEVARGEASVKPLRGGEQTTVSFDALAAHLVAMISK